jgi:hypothetical protein
MVTRELTDELKAKIIARANAFDPVRLVDLLSSYGFAPEDVLFESNPERASASIVDSIRFEANGTVVVRVNMGLLGDRGTLPSYFQRVVEESGDPDAFQDFIRFFDDRLISNLLRVTYPERDKALFEDWPRTVAHFRRIAAIGAESLLQSLLQKTFPELRVHVKRSAIPRAQAEASLVMGSAGLDGGGLLGAGQMVEPRGFSVSLVAFEPTAGGGRRWAEVIVDRLVQRMEPVLSGQRLALDIELVVVDHEDVAGLKTMGFLGYERMGGGHSAIHALRIYRGMVGHDPIALT